MVTAKIEEIDRLLGLEIGADDYICKPYSPREVVARVKTILRRCKPQRELQQQDAESPLIIDEGRFQASWRGKMLDLTPAEFRLLKTLSHEPGKVFSREQLLNHLYDDYRVVTDRTIDSHIKNLRRKLESRRRTVIYPRRLRRRLPLGSRRLPHRLVLATLLC